MNEYKHSPYLRFSRTEICSSVEELDVCVFAVNGRSKQIGLKNESADSVAEIVQALRDQSGYLHLF